MEADGCERLVYTRRSTTTKILRRTSTLSADSSKDLAEAEAGAEAEASVGPQRSQGNQGASVDNGKMFVANNGGASASNHSCGPALVVTRQTGQLSQTRSDRHHYQASRESYEGQQLGRNSSNNGQSQKVRRLLIQESEQQQQHPQSQRTPANVRLNEHDVNYADGNHQIRFTNNNCSHNNYSNNDNINGHNNNTPSQAQMQTSKPFQRHQQRSQSQFDTDKHRARNHYDHYHHYDVSQLASPIAAGSAQPNWGSRNQHDDNVYLFATEHHRRAAADTVGGRRSSSRMSSSYSSPSMGQMAGGRFVNYYPSWRQTQSPATCNTNQYSFHLPFAHAADRYNVAASQRGQPRQTRYGFVAPADRVRLISPERPDNREKPLERSFRSQTISHLPSMVKVTCSEVASQRASAQQQAEASRFGYENIDYAAKASGYFRKSNGTGANDDDDDNNDDHYYDGYKGELAPGLPGNHRDVHRVARDDGFDNPFRPGTELSWEADMMVKLMARGYPMQELPQLIEAAKQVARQRSSKGQEPEPIGGGLSRRPKKPGANDSRSSDDLINLGKQVWANSLSRAKSMPRFNVVASDASARQKDNDSIDKLIASIENEMSELLGQVDEQRKRCSQKSKTLPTSQSEEPLLAFSSYDGYESAKTHSASKLFHSSRMPNLTKSKTKSNRQQEVTRTGNPSAATHQPEDLDDGHRKQVMKKSRSECCRIH